MGTQKTEDAKGGYALNRWDACSLGGLLPVVYLSAYLLSSYLGNTVRLSDKVSFGAIVGFATLWLALRKSLKLNDIDLSKRLLVTLEAIVLAIICPAIAYFGAFLFIYPVFYILDRVPLYLFWTVIVGLDVVWFMLMLRWRSIHPHARVLLTCLVLTFSASLAIICPIVIHVLSGPAFVVGLGTKS
jgi:hypothetical protein